MLIQVLFRVVPADLGLEYSRIDEDDTCFDINKLKKVLQAQESKR